MSKTQTKEAQKFPCIVGKLTAEEVKAAQAMNEAEKKAIAEGGLSVLFGDMPEEVQELKHDFWPKLYRAHKLDPQRDYEINLEERTITQMSGAVDPDTIQ